MGFSAHTGDVSDEHDIISISTHNVVWHPPVPGSATKKRGASKYGARGGSGSWLFAIVKWLFLAVLVCVAVIVFKSYRSKKSAKRF